jgi:hypothetical protein
MKNMDQLPQEMIELILGHTLIPFACFTHIWRFRRLNKKYKDIIDRLLTRILLVQDLKLRMTYILPLTTNGGAAFAPNSWLSFSHYDSKTRSLHFLPPNSAKFIHVGWHTSPPLVLEEFSDSERHLPTVDLVSCIMRKGDNEVGDMKELGSPFRLFQIPLPPEGQSNVGRSSSIARQNSRLLLSTETSLSYSFGLSRSVESQFISDLVHSTSTGLYSLESQNETDLDSSTHTRYDSIIHSLQVSRVTLSIGRLFRLFHPEKFTLSSTPPPPSTSINSASALITHNTHNKVQFSRITQQLDLITGKKIDTFFKMVNEVGLDIDPIMLHLNVEARWYWSHATKDEDICVLCDAEHEEWIHQHLIRNSTPTCSMNLFLSNFNFRDSTFRYIQFEQVLNRWLIQCDDNLNENHVNDEMIRTELQKLANRYKNTSITVRKNRLQLKFKSLNSTRNDCFTRFGRRLMRFIKSL